MKEIFFILITFLAVGFAMYFYIYDPCVLPVKDIPASKLKECLNQ